MIIYPLLSTQLVDRGVSVTIVNDNICYISPELPHICLLCDMFRSKDILLRVVAHNLSPELTLIEKVSLFSLPHVFNGIFYLVRCQAVKVQTIFFETF